MVHFGRYKLGLQLRAAKLLRHLWKREGFERVALPYNGSSSTLGKVGFRVCANMLAFNWEKVTFD